MCMDSQTAFRYLSMIAVPLVIGYSIYSVLYETHKSWYSFLLNTAVGFVYAFGACPHAAAVPRLGGKGRDRQRERERVCV
jgi:undecaprenyl pyrophosphate phosphatase UppP